MRVFTAPKKYLKISHDYDCCFAQPLFHYNDWTIAYGACEALTVHSKGIGMEATTIRPFHTEELDGSTGLWLIAPRRKMTSLGRQNFALLKTGFTISRHSQMRATIRFTMNQQHSKTWNSLSNHGTSGRSCGGYGCPLRWGGWLCCCWLPCSAAGDRGAWGLLERILKHAHGTVLEKRLTEMWSAILHVLESH